MNEITFLDFCFYSWYYIKAKYFSKEDDNETEE